MVKLCLSSCLLLEIRQTMVKDRSLQLQAFTRTVQGLCGTEINLNHRTNGKPFVTFVITTLTFETGFVVCSSNEIDLGKCLW